MAILAIVCYVGRAQETRTYTHIARASDQNQYSCLLGSGGVLLAKEVSYVSLIIIQEIEMKEALAY